MKRWNAGNTIVMAACLACCGVTLAREPRPAWDSDADAPAIVTLQTQSCDGPVALGWNLHPREAEFRRSGAMPFGDTGYRIEFDRLGAFRRLTIAERLHDRSRGVDDSYALFSASGLSPYRAAYVVTRMLQGQEMQPEALLGAAVEAQRRNASGGRASFIEIETPFGKGLEMVVGGRVGSGCFPTSPFVYADDPAQSSIGISRFVVRGGDLVEYALVVPWPRDVPQATMIERAREALAPLEDALRVESPGGARGGRDARRDDGTR